MKPFKDVFPPLYAVMKMEPEELPNFLLEFLCECEEDRNMGGYLNRYNFTLGNAFKGYLHLSRGLTQSTP